MSHVTKLTRGKMKIQNGHENENPRGLKTCDSSVVESLGGPQKMTPTFGYDDIIFNLFKNTKPKIQNPREAVEEMRIQKKTHIVTIAQSLSN